MVKIIIVGRPNVGKSALFNALVGENLSLVDKSPGTTRDLVYGVRSYNNICLNFIDSAGIGFEKIEIYKKAIAQTMKMLNSVDLILFVVDVKTQLTDEDFYISSILSKNAFEKTVLVINKVDDNNALSNVYKFYKLKYKYTFLTSAAHKKGIKEIIDFIYERFKNVISVPITKNDAIKVAIIGKRGVGKSSYINVVFNKEVRLVSSKSPTTRDIGKFEYSIFNNNFVLYDTAGLFKIKGNVDSPDFYAVKKVYDIMEKVDLVFLMLDITDCDTYFDKYLCRLLLDSKKLMLLLFNKIDMLERKEFEYKKKYILKKFTFMNYVPSIFLSAKETVNVFKPFEFAVSLYKQAKTHLQTSVLNKIVADISSEKVFKRYGKLGKIYYVTQLGILPVRIAFFVNNKNLFKPSDLRFLENRIRMETGLLNIPIMLKLFDKNSPP